MYRARLEVKTTGCLRTHQEEKARYVGADFVDHSLSVRNRATRRQLHRDAPGFSTLTIWTMTQSSCFGPVTEGPDARLQRGT